jgi:mRNA interferase MazF
MGQQPGYPYSARVRPGNSIGRRHRGGPSIESGDIGHSRSAGTAIPVERSAGPSAEEQYAWRNRMGPACWTGNLVKSTYFPKRGDLIWLDFSPQAGHEQAGRRPAAVISGSQYNRKVGLLLACPITSQRKNYPFEVLLPGGLPITGVILADQVRSLDWKSRQAEFIGRVGEDVMAETLGKLAALIDDESLGRQSREQG